MRIHIEVVHVFANGEYRRGLPEFIEQLQRGEPVLCQFKPYGRHLVGIVLYCGDVRLKADMTYPYCPYELKKAHNVEAFLNDEAVEWVYRFILRKDQNLDELIHHAINIVKFLLEDYAEELSLIVMKNTDLLAMQLSYGGGPLDAWNLVYDTEPHLG